MSDSSAKQKFGTLPVFLTSISTILGAILFLRFGWAVGHVGLVGTLLIVLIGHLVTIPTSLAIAEIATNQRVEGGGAYYIISRSFGLNIGGAIGIALYISQAISVAFYVVAFAQSTGPIFDWVESEFGIVVETFGYRLVSIPTMILLSLLVLTRGANSGMALLYVVATILFISLAMFFVGTPSPDVQVQYDSITEIFNKVFDKEAFSQERLVELGIDKVNKPTFFYVFTIIFPAFTGIIAGLGLSGDLRDPGKSIPVGTLLATVIGMVIYLAVAVKMSMSLPPEILVNKERLVMSDIAIWGPIIPIGLAAAAISSALGSILVAPRTLQALGADKVFPSESGNSWLAKIRKKDDEPVNGSIISIIIAMVFVAIGDVDLVAEIISMFFMVTYGAICLISFLEHFSSNPAYRPSFNSRWYLSLPGAVLTIWLMFKMNLPYAIASLVLMVGIYFWVSRYNQNQGGMVRIFQGVIFQISRSLRVMLQKAGGEEESEEHWVPSVICISQDSFDRTSGFDMVRFIAHKYGFGTYIHMIKDYYSRTTVAESRDVRSRLLKRTKISQSKVYVDTMISPSYTSALAQTLQMPGISGQDNNMILFEYSPIQMERLKDIVENFGLIKAAGFDVVILKTGEKGFGYKHEIHIWLTAEDLTNGNLMILMAYIILGHPEWKRGLIKIFAIYPENEASDQKEKLIGLINQGRLAISPNNVEVIARKEERSIKAIINQRSGDADLTIVGFHQESLKKHNEEVFGGYEKLGNVIFVNTDKEKIIA
ncbi:MAG: amino acid permease [Bacteroidia bacterium]|nr:amino acid permease [Bacteroidia bacterium]